MNCVKCGSDVGDHTNSTVVSLSPMGDEDTYGYWFCSRCEVYTRMRWYDPFHGEEKTYGPIEVDRERGDAIVALIRTCPDPTLKSCPCDAHVKLFRLI